MTTQRSAIVYTVTDPVMAGWRIPSFSLLSPLAPLEIKSNETKRDRSTVPASIVDELESKHSDVVSDRWDDAIGW